MPLKDSIQFYASFAIANIPIFFHILTFLSFSLLYKAVGVDPVAKSTFFSLESLPSLTASNTSKGYGQRRGRGRGERPPCPYANVNVKSRGEADLDAVDAKDTGEHAYRAPGPDDFRSPCPALNTMANHGYIPRNGKNLTGTNLTHGLIQCYNLSWPLAAFLAWGGVLLLGQVGELSLRDLARHNRIEHDASLTHPNTHQGEEYAPVHSSSELFAEFLEDASKSKSNKSKSNKEEEEEEGRGRGRVFTSTEIARARIRREAEPGTEVTAVQQEIARGEVALVLQIFGGMQFAVPVEVVERWWGEERLPEGWRPTRKTTLLGTVYWATQIRGAMQRMREEAKKAEKTEKVQKTEKVKVKRTVFEEKATAVAVNGNGKPNGHVSPPSSSSSSPSSSITAGDFEQMDRAKTQNASYEDEENLSISSSVSDSSTVVQTPAPSPTKKHVKLHTT